MKGSAKVSGSTLEFACVTDVPIMRPELLEEQTGRREIKRINFFRGELRAKETMNAKVTSCFFFCICCCTGQF